MDLAKSGEQEKKEAAGVNTAGDTSETDTVDIVSGGGLFDGEVSIAPCELANEQFAVLSRVLSTIDQNRPKGQTLTLVHSGGGTGKSFVVRQICQGISKRHYQVVSCPTGAGACQLMSGMTFHSALKYCSKSRKQRLSARAAAFLRRLFSPRVVLVVVDEVSMLEAELLVVLDEHFRHMYNPDAVFGGKSILLVRSCIL